uniref:Photosystem I assembly protein Ycf4 n=1 Tax=Compsopogon caeruleus TaxID=31354 RepID=A0A1Z1XBE8_9RHOD|nr:photosystem I assembly protein [Compsopogon caeruleus]ARX96150.1 photosystem I assembly protein [Compsopogon caeruleus]
MDYINKSINLYMNTKIDKIAGSRRLSNYWWATIILLGGLGFLLAGLSSYLKLNLLPFSNTKNLIFIPQGILMIFYGTLAIFISLFLWLTIFFNIGGGYNKYDKDNGYIEIFRLGFPGKNRKISLRYKIQEIQSIKVDIIEGINPRREIYLSTKDQRQIPLTRVGQPLSLQEIEEKASELANFLGVILEGL